MACTQRYDGGFLLVEVILASTIFVFIATIFIGAYLYGQEATAVSGMRARASLLADEGLEALRNMRDGSFNNLTNGTFGLALSGGQWILSGTSDVTGIFTRQVVITQISANEKNATVNITWQQTPQRTGLLTRSTRLTHWRGSWATPFQQDVFDVSGNQDGLKIQVQGNYAYLVRNTGTPNFGVFDVADPANPVLVGPLTLAGNPTNIFVLGNFAYVSNSSGSAEMQVVNIATPAAPVLAGTYNDAGTEAARGVFATGTTAYLALNGGNDFVIVNVTTPATPTFVGGLPLNGGAYEVWTSGTFAYVASSDDAQEMQVVNITTPATPTLAGSWNGTGTDDVFTITGFGTTTVVGRGGAGGISSINITTPATPATIGTAATSGIVNDIALGNSNRYVFAATAAATEFQVFDINPATPTLVGSLNLSAAVNGIAVDQTNLRAYIAGTTNTEELTVLMPL